MVNFFVTKISFLSKNRVFCSIANSRFILNILFKHLIILHLRHIGYLLCSRFLSPHLYGRQDPPLCLISGNTQTWHDHRPGETQVWNPPDWPPYRGKLTFGIHRPDVLKNGNARATIKVLSSGLFDWPHCEGRLKYGIPGPGDTNVLHHPDFQPLHCCCVLSHLRLLFLFLL